MCASLPASAGVQKGCGVLTGPAVTLSACMRQGDKARLWASIPESCLEVNVDQDVTPPKPPVPEVIYANVVSVNLTNDDVLMEFWEHRVGHSQPGLPSEQIVKTKSPIARVIIPFKVAQWLRKHLNDNLTTVENSRKAGQ